MKTRSKKPRCIGRHAGKSEQRLPVKNQAGIEKCAAGTNFSSEDASGPQNWEKSNLRLLDSASPKKSQKAKRIKWIHEEYMQVIAAFYQALNEPKITTQTALMKFGEKNRGVQDQGVSNQEQHV